MEPGTRSIQVYPVPVLPRRSFCTCADKLGVISTSRTDLETNKHQHQVAHAKYQFCAVRLDLDPLRYPPSLVSCLRTLGYFLMNEALISTENPAVMEHMIVYMSAALYLQPHWYSPENKKQKSPYVGQVEWEDWGISATQLRMRLTDLGPSRI